MLNPQCHMHGQINLIRFRLIVQSDPMKEINPTPTPSIFGCLPIYSFHCPHNWVLSLGVPQIRRDWIHLSSDYIPPSPRETHFNLN